eukprot:scaffold2131_cov113-Isochrysis_galbana.AAC.3
MAASPAPSSPSLWACASPCPELLELAAEPCPLLRTPPRSPLTTRPYSAASPINLFSPRSPTSQRFTRPHSSALRCPSPR